MSWPIPLKTQKAESAGFIMAGKIIDRGNIADLGQNRHFFPAIIILSKVVPIQYTPPKKWGFLRFIYTKSLLLERLLWKFEGWGVFYDYQYVRICVAKYSISNFKLSENGTDLEVSWPIPPRNTKSWVGRKIIDRENYGVFGQNRHFFPRHNNPE